MTTQARGEADRTVGEAKVKAEKMITDAHNEATIIREKSSGLRESVRTEYTKLSENVQQLITTLNDLYGSSIGSVNQARDLIDEGLELVEGNPDFNESVKGSDVSAEEQQSSGNSEEDLMAQLADMANEAMGNLN